MPALVGHVREGPATFLEMSSGRLFIDPEDPVLAGAYVFEHRLRRHQIYTEYWFESDSCFAEPRADPAEQRIPARHRPHGGRVRRDPAAFGEAFGDQPAARARAPTASTRSGTCSRRPVDPGLPLGQRTGQGSPRTSGESRVLLGLGPVRQPGPSGAVIAGPRPGSDSRVAFRINSCVASGDCSGGAEAWRSV